MCGICINVHFHDEGSCPPQQNIILKDFSLKLRRRGPNHFAEHVQSFEKVNLQFLSSVLHLQGASLTAQPFIDEWGNVLLWNGEIFSGDLASNIESDTMVLSREFGNCEDASSILNVVGKIRGPFAFAYYQQNGLLWFGRDIFGRRSLLWASQDENFHLSSIAYDQHDWKELPCNGIYCLNLSLSASDHFFVHYYPWSSSPSGVVLEDEFRDLPTFVVLNIVRHISVQSPLSRPLNKSLVYASPNECDTECTDGAIQHPIAVAYQDEESPDKILFSKLSTSYPFKKNIVKLEELLSQSIERRVKKQPGICKDCYPQNLKNCLHSTVGVLFSGGLDSITIALLTDRFVPREKPIDLINVSFIKRPIDSSTNASTVTLTPDRITGSNGVLTLRRLSPYRRWNFVEVDVWDEEFFSIGHSIVNDLLKPACTVLDESIGCALWFASRGMGMIMDEFGKYTTYHSPVRVLLLGMGADEQFAGYSRHRKKFQTGSWSSLLDELAMDIDRIGCRNLGRDDRTIADHGVESRYPFLDEDVVSYLNELCIWIKTDLKYGPGVGDKLLLRLLAFKLGLRDAALLPKRAIQFGSRVASIQGVKGLKGSDICERFAKVPL